MMHRWWNEEYSVISMILPVWYNNPWICWIKYQHTACYSCHWSAPPAPSSAWTPPRRTRPGTRQGSPTTYPAYLLIKCFCDSRVSVTFLMHVIGWHIGILRLLRMSSTEGHLPSKVISTEGSIPPKDVFHLPPWLILYMWEQSTYQISASYCA